MTSQFRPRSAKKETIFERRESKVRSYSNRFPAKFTEALGARLISADGVEYIDFLAGCSSLNYGHNHPVLKAALMDYVAEDGITHSLDMETGAKEAFLTAFDEVILSPRGLDYVVQFPGPTGANAVEAALKIARKVTGRTNVIAFTNGFHGCTLGALALTGNQHHRGGAGLPLIGVTRVPYEGYFGEGVDTAAQIEKMLDDPSSGIDAPAAIILETVQGEGGLNVASKEWLIHIAALAKKVGALLIVDDIQAGCGRTGSFFSFEAAGLKPDIVTMAKSISGYGLPMALTLIKRDLDVWEPGEHNGTFRGNCHAFVTATAALDAFWRDADFEGQIAEKGAFLKSRLERIAAKHKDKVIGIKGRGMMLGLDVGSGEIASKIIKACYDRRLIIETSGSDDEIVKCLMPLTIVEADFKEGLDILEEAADVALENTVRAAA